MNEYAVITNRKRAIIALVHSVAFLLIALYNVATANALAPIWVRNSSFRSSLVVLSIFTIVSSVLIYLVRVSRGTTEKLYFAFCASSATLGLLRTIFGDAYLHAGQPLRVLMLLSAVTTGTLILRRHGAMSMAADSDL